MMCHRTIRYATNAKMTTVYQMKSQNESHIEGLPFLEEKDHAEWSPPDE